MSEMGYVKAKNDAVRYTQDILLSVTVALACITVVLHSSIYWSGQFIGWMWGFNRLFHRAVRDDLGNSLAFYSWAPILAVGIVVVLRASSRASLVTKILETVAGILAITAPALTFWLVRYYQPENYMNVRQLGWLPYEEGIVVVFALLYVFRRRPIPTWVSVILVLLLTFHCVLWCRAYWITLAFGQPHQLAVPIIAYFSILMWSYWIRGPRREAHD